MTTSIEIDRMNQEFIDEGTQFHIMTAPEAANYMSGWEQQLELLPLLNRYGQPRGVKNFRGEVIYPEFDDYQIDRRGDFDEPSVTIS
jgi:hypothetical protein